MRELHIITDMQFGSCGKGLFAGYLAKKVLPDTVVTAWAPNAGHTYIDEYGQKFVNISLPNAIVCPSVKRILIGPGSVIDPERMRSEISRYDQWLIGKEILIHPHAAVVLSHHSAKEREAGLGRIGSTLKGAMAAVVEKMSRPVPPSNTAMSVFAGDIGGNLSDLAKLVARDPHEWDLAMDLSKVMLVEGAQGFSLSMNQGFYPYVTSRECTTHQLLSDCAIPHNYAFCKVYGVCRTYPIRVNNRDGWSGPCYPDQHEISWAELGIEPELTTVTRLPRRVFTFSRQQATDAVRMNGIAEIFLNFCNYVHDDAILEGIIKDMEYDTGARVKWAGWGPKVNDIREL